LTGKRNVVQSMDGGCETGTVRPSIRPVIHDRLEVKATICQGVRQIRRRTLSQARWILSDRTRSTDTRPQELRLDSRHNVSCRRMAFSLPVPYWSYGRPCGKSWSRDGSSTKPVVALHLKSRIRVLKPRTKLRLKFVRVLSAPDQLDGANALHTSLPLCGRCGADETTPNEQKQWRKCGLFRLPHIV
jgi:hypothetical protein